MLQGLSAIVTGSTTGIGLGVARQLAAAKVNICLNGFGNVDTIDKIRKDMSKQNNVDVIYSPANMLNRAELSDMVKFAHTEFGKVDILVNNAGIQHTSPVEHFSDESWQKIFDIDLSAPFYLTKDVLPHMRTTKFGRIINIASAHGLVGSIHKAAYVAAKHGLVGLTKVVALETANLGDITCNAVCPGFVKTHLIENQIAQLAENRGIDRKKASLELLGGKQPNERFVMPEEIGDMVVFLCSDSGRNITGSSISMDGGWTSQ